MICKNDHHLIDKTCPPG